MILSYANNFTTPYRHVFLFSSKKLPSSRRPRYNRASYPKEIMLLKTVGNILWFLLGGVLSGLSWILAGCIWCVTIVGIPVGLQCFKFASLAFWPFGKQVIYGGGAGSTILNIFWLLVSGIPLAVENAAIGLILCITIVGIPFGKQFFKIAKLALTPFGARVE